MASTRRVLIYNAKCRDTCNQRTEEVSAAFDESALARAGPDSKKFLVDFFRYCGYCVLDIYGPQTLSIKPATSDHGDLRQHGSYLCPLCVPGAPPLLCVLDCGEYEHGCYAIRTAFKR